jgi:hypothetical protein
MAHPTREKDDRPAMLDALATPGLLLDAHLKSILDGDDGHGMSLDVKLWNLPGNVRGTSQRAFVGDGSEAPSFVIG